MRDGLATKQDMAAIDHRFELMDTKMDTLDFKFEAKIDALDQKFETKFDFLDKKIDRVETSLRGEIRTLEATLRSEIWQSANRTVIWLGGIMIALSGIVLAIVKLGH